MRDILIACAAIGTPVALVLILEWRSWRSHPRDRRSAALRRANSPPLEGEKK